MVHVYGFGLGFKVWCSRFGVQGLGFQNQGLGCRGQGVGFEV